MISSYLIRVFYVSVWGGSSININKYQVVIYNIIYVLNEAWIHCNLQYMSHKKL